MNLLDRIAYDTGGYTVQEILSSFCKKILEIIDLVNKNEEVCDEAYTLIENIRNEVVPDLVNDIMKELQDNGYFDSLVNVTLIEQLRTELTTLLNQTITDYTTRLDNFDSQLDTKANNNKYLKYRITHNLPIHFSVYRDYLTLLNCSFIYPQGFYICEDKLYIIYEPDWTNRIKKSVVVVRNFINGDYITSFVINGGFGESIVVKREGVTLYLYAKSKEYHLGKYDITNVVEKEEIRASDEINVGLYSNFDYCQKTKQWYIEQASREIGQTSKRSLIEVYTESFTRIRQFSIPPSISGLWNGDYVDYVSKKQGFAVVNGEIILGCGGLYRSGVDIEKPYNYQGIKTVLLNGELKSSSLIKPTTFINKLIEKDVIAERIENEGITIYNGKKYVLYCTLGDTEKSLETGMLILEMDSNECDLDFTNDYANEPVVNYNQINSSLFPRNGDKLLNPFTGLEMNTLKDIYTFITQGGLSRLTFYTTSVTITDINGVALPQGYLAKVYNANNRTMIVELHGYDIGTIVYNVFEEDNTLKQKMVSGAEYDLSSLLIGGVTTNTKLKAKKEDSFVKICGVLANIPQTKRPITLIEDLPVELRPKFNTHHVVALSGSINGGYGTVSVLSNGKITFNYDTFGTSEYLTIDINYLL